MTGNRLEGCRRHVLGLFFLIMYFQYLFLSVCLPVFFFFSALCLSAFREREREREKERERERERERETDRQTDSQTDRQTGRQAEREREREDGVRNRRMIKRWKEKKERTAPSTPRWGRKKNSKKPIQYKENESKEEKKEKEKKKKKQRRKWKKKKGNKDERGGKKRRRDLKIKIKKRISEWVLSEREWRGAFNPIWEAINGDSERA